MGGWIFFFPSQVGEGHFGLRHLPLEMSCKVSTILRFEIQRDHSECIVHLFLVINNKVSPQQREMEAFLVKISPLWRTGRIYSATHNEARVSVTALQKATHDDNAPFGM